MLFHRGDVSIHHKSGHFVVDNAKDGFSLHQLDGATFIRSFAPRVPLKNTWPKQVAFGENGNVVVGGSDHGAVYIFEKRSGHTLQIMEGPQHLLMHTITVRLVDVWVT